MRFFNEIAESNPPRIVVFPKNSYQTFFARNELKHADRRIREFVRQIHSQFIMECAKSFHKATAACARHGRTLGFSSCDASILLTELRFAGSFPKTIHRRDIRIRSVALLWPPFASRAHLTVRLGRP